jgi:predicted nucleotidyltransferase
MTSKEKKIAGSIHDKIKEKDPDAEIILYGSRARGDNRNDSDWDILILIDKAKESRTIEKKYRDAMFELELEIEQPISTLIFSKSDWNSKYTVTPFYENILREGVQLS